MTMLDECKLKMHSNEWDAYWILRNLETPAEDASLTDKHGYWIQMKRVAELALLAACNAAEEVGKARRKEKNNE